MIQSLMTDYSEGDLRDESQFLVNYRSGLSALHDPPEEQAQDVNREIGSLLHM
jgi:hypothetical protein